MMQPPPDGSRDVQVKIGPNGIKVSGVEAPPSAEVAALQAQVGVLQQRVARLKEERSELVSEADNADNRETQSAVRERLQTVQGQLAESEATLRSAEDRLAALGIGPAPERFTETREALPPPSNDIPQNLKAISIISIMFVGAPLAVAISRWIWRRSSPAPARSAAEAQQLQRLEQSVDAMALELERISEGQRFVTKLLADHRGLGSAAAEPIRLPQSDAVSRP